MGDVYKVSEDKEESWSLGLAERNCSLVSIRALVILKHDPLGISLVELMIAFIVPACSYPVGNHYGYGVVGVASIRETELLALSSLLSPLLHLVSGHTVIM